MNGETAEPPLENMHNTFLCVCDPCTFPPSSHDGCHRRHEAPAYMSLGVLSTRAVYNALFPI